MAHQQRQQQHQQLTTTTTTTNYVSNSSSNSNANQQYFYSTSTPTSSNYLLAAPQQQQYPSNFRPVAVQQPEMVMMSNSSLMVPESYDPAELLESVDMGGNDHHHYQNAPQIQHHEAEFTWPIQISRQQQQRHRYTTQQHNQLSKSWCPGTGSSNYNSNSAAARPLARPSDWPTNSGSAFASGRKQQYIRNNQNQQPKQRCATSASTSGQQANWNGQQQTEKYNVKFQYNNYNVNQQQHQQQRQNQHQHHEQHAALNRSMPYGGFRSMATSSSSIKIGASRVTGSERVTGEPATSCADGSDFLSYPIQRPQQQLKSHQNQHQHQRQRQHQPQQQTPAQSSDANQYDN